MTTAEEIAHLREQGLRAWREAQRMREQSDRERAQARAARAQAARVKTEAKEKLLIGSSRAPRRENGRPLSEGARV